MKEFEMARLSSEGFALLRRRSISNSFTGMVDCGESFRDTLWGKVVLWGARRAELSLPSVTTPSRILSQGWLTAVGCLEIRCVGRQFYEEYNEVISL